MHGWRKAHDVVSISRGKRSDRGSGHSTIKSTDSSKLIHEDDEKKQVTDAREKRYILERMLAKSLARDRGTQLKPEGSRGSQQSPREERSLEIKGIDMGTLMRQFADKLGVSSSGETGARSQFGSGSRDIQDADADSDSRSRMGREKSQRAGMQMTGMGKQAGEKTQHGAQSEGDQGGGRSLDTLTSDTSGSSEPCSVSGIDAQRGGLSRSSPQGMGGSARESMGSMGRGAESTARSGGRSLDRDSASSYILPISKLVAYGKRAGDRGIKFLTRLGELDAVSFATAVVRGDISGGRTADGDVLIHRVDSSRVAVSGEGAEKFIHEVLGEEDQSRASGSYSPGDAGPSDVERGWFSVGYREAEIDFAPSIDTARLLDLIKRLKEYVPDAGNDLHRALENKRTPIEFVTRFVERRRRGKKIDALDRALFKLVLEKTATAILRNNRKLEEDLATDTKDVLGEFKGYEDVGRFDIVKTDMNLAKGIMHIVKKTRSRGGKSRNVYILIDRSGSMSGEKILIACGLATAIAMKNPEHTFTVVAFDYGAHVLLDKESDLDKVTDTISRIEPAGGTNYLTALKYAIESAEEGDYIAVVGDFIDNSYIPDRLVSLAKSKGLRIYLGYTVDSDIAYFNYVKTRLNGSILKI